MVKLRHFFVFIVLFGIVGAKFSEDDLSHLARLLKLGAGTGQKTKETRGMHVLSDVKREKKENLEEQLQQIKHEVIRILMNKVSQKRWIENDSSIRGTSGATPRTTGPPQSTTRPSRLLKTTSEAPTTTIKTIVKPTSELPNNLAEFWKLFWRLQRIPIS